LQHSLPSDKIDIIVRTAKQADWSTLPAHATYDDKIAYLKNFAGQAQRDLLSYLNTLESTEVLQCFWLASEVHMVTTAENISQIANRTDVGQVFDNFKVSAVPISPTTRLRVFAPSGTSARFRRTRAGRQDIRGAESSLATLTLA
jgi:hypothetical protein